MEIETEIFYGIGTLEEENSSTFDFLTAKESILKEIHQIPEEDRRDLGIPEIFPEKNEIKIQFPAPQFSKEQLADIIQILKNHIENLRIQTFEAGFYSIQALNDNIFETKNMLDNIRFRFYQTKTQNRVEISKKGNLKVGEIFAIIHLYKFFLPKNGKKTLHPKDLLAKLGIQVFDPEEERLKGAEFNFSMVAGYEDVKREIQDSIILPIQKPEAFDEIAKLTRKIPGRNRPRAVLFEGDPGVGKTTMARVVAYQCNIPLVYVPIESIMSKYYGESSQNLAYVFDAAALFPSALIFLDEIDALAGNRDDGMFEATRNLLSVLLRKLDGFEGKPKTITLGATNRKQDLDRALLSRFDKSIYFPLPNLHERKEILKTYAMQLSDEEALSIAELLEGSSGRNIKDFCDYVERKWASKIILSGQEITAPDFSTYQETAKNLIPKPKY